MAIRSILTFFLFATSLLFFSGCFAEDDDHYRLNTNNDYVGAIDNEESIETGDVMCSDGKDNDGDDLIDCDDPNCFGSGECIREFDCDDGKDNDLDGEEDCKDEDCYYTPECYIVDVENTYEDCTDKLDNDNDGRVDCNDTGCSKFEHCIENTEEYCTDGEDNDDDGQIDCDDPGCSGIANCKENTEEACSDGVDNDGDSYADCQDPGCEFVASCLPEVNCTDSVDNDHDELTDCDDPDCALAPGCVSTLLENNVVLCSDEIDNDEDSFADCDDSDCKDFAHCQENNNVACDDDIDNDGDGLIDCQDPGCAGVNVCNSGASCLPPGFEYPEVWELPVTIIDYNGGSFSSSCPGDLSNTRVYGMVDSLLSPEGYPQLGENLCSNGDIEQWWNPDNPAGGFAGVKDTVLDFAFKGGSVYLYATHAMGFFPMGGCDEGTGNNTGTECKGQKNYAFGLHLHHEFTYAREAAREQTFNFSGDDDVFVFLNGHLVLDIGGIHQPQSDAFNFFAAGEEIGLKDGDDAYIDFFIAERSPSGSQAVISLSLPCMVIQ